jgi:aminomuconate-semialdehyde/2-hydroxymuconate-6-semialdehyde dehydrogenase
MTRAIEYLNAIGGEFVRTASTFEDRCPADGRLVATVHEAGRDEVDRAVQAAKAALKGPWGRMTTDERSALLHKVADEITRRFDDFVAAEMADTGQPIGMMRHAFIPRGAANFKVFADLVKSVPTESFMLPTPNGGQALNYSIRKPKGVVAVICPWNAPLLLMTWKVAPALACGNTVIVKPSEETPGTATLLAEVMNAVGVPAGVYNVVHGFGPDSAGEFLTQHRDVDAITFTGETRTGAAIMKAASDGIRDVSFELGGKNAGIVFADADLDKTMEGLGRAAFQNCGQICLGTERIYVQRPVFDEFVERFAAHAATLKPGDPNDHSTTLGPLISAEHLGKVTSYYDLAVAEGATVVTGGGRPSMPDELAGGNWIQPTLWMGLSEQSRTVREEIFGPCSHVQPFDDADEAVALANDTSYGLATTIWTQNLSTAHRVAAEVEVGITWVNSWFLRDLRTPFGGSKQSGIGREGGVHSMEFYTELRNVCVQL